MPLQRFSLKRRLIGVILLSSVVALSVTYAALLAYEFHAFREGTAHNLTALARIIASNSSAALIYDDKALAEENLAALRSEPDITAAALYDQHGRLYATYPAKGAPANLPLSPGKEAMEFRGGRLNLFYPVVQDQRYAGTLYLTSDLGEMYGRLRIYGGVLLVVLMGSMGVSLFLSNFFQRQISGPILELAAMARLISEQKNYAIRARSPSDDELGDLTGAFNAMLDQIQASHSEAERARDEALKASRAKDDFLAALSHELRTPLNPVLLLASDAAARPDLPEAIRADFDLIRKNVELEARLIDDLLDLTRITSGKLVLNGRLIDPLRVLEDAIETVRPEAAAKRIAFSLALGSGQPMVWGDSVRLQQVFWNVLKNAVKFTPEGGWITVAMREDSESGRILITVADNGIGLTGDEIPRLFRVFSQGAHADGEPHRFGGLGLGLAISRTLVELHAGTIRVASDGRGKGATFIIDLPLASTQTETLRSSPGPAASPSAARVPRERSILLVEDHAPTRTILARMLQSRGYRVLTAASIAEARVSAAGGGIDVLISDIGLPDGSGYDLMAELSARFPLKGIALTGYGMEHDLDDSRRAGFAAHLTKPVRIQMIDDALGLIFQEGRS